MYLFPLIHKFNKFSRSSTITSEVLAGLWIMPREPSVASLPSLESAASCKF